MSDKEFLFKITDQLNSVGMVYFINEVFGNRFGDENKNTHINQTKNLFDELDELKEAIGTKDGKEAIDAAGDLLTFVYGTCYFCGLDAEQVNSILPSRDASTVMQFYDLINNSTDNLVADFQAEREYLPELNRLVALIKGLCELLDVDEGVLMKRITISNLTKVCTSPEETQATVKKYQDMGVDVYTKENTVRGVLMCNVYSSKEQTVGGKMYRENKFLKSVNFEEPVLNDLVTNKTISTLYF